MSARKIFSIIGIVISALLIVCLFLPFLNLGEYGGTYSWWEYLDRSKATATSIIIIIELLIAILAYILQLTNVSKDSKLAFLGLGYFFTYHLSLFFTALNNEAFNELAFGYWFGFILSLTAIVITIIAIFVSNESKPKYRGYYPQQPIGYDPKTGQPIFSAPQQIVGYDPHTGEPIYK